MIPSAKTQIPYATARALTAVAQTGQKSIKQTMREVFDRPNPYTLNSTFIVPATKTSLFSEVRLKNFGGTKSGTPASVYLAPQVFGGDRQLKRSEVLLQRKGVLPGGMFWVPGNGATLDSYGNISRGQIAQVLSAVSGFQENGFLANKSFRRGARMNKQTNDIFVINKPGQRLSMGIYRRTKTGETPLMIFVNQPRYGIKLPFSDVVSVVYVASFQDEFAKAFKDAVATAIVK